METLDWCPPFRLRLQKAFWMAKSFVAGQRQFLQHLDLPARLQSIGSKLSPL
jgi:hypothetical protein